MITPPEPPPKTASTSPKRPISSARKQRERCRRTQQLQENGHHAFLQVTSAYGRCELVANCKASDRAIRSKYRVLVAKKRFSYFHVECFEDRYDVPLLVPTRHFGMEDPAACGLMIHKWFQRNRLVDLDAIAEYIMDDNCYRYGLFLPRQPMLELKDYATWPGNRCSLKDPVENPMCGCFRKKALALASVGA